MSDETPIAALQRALPALPRRLQEAARFVARHDFDAVTRSMRDLAAAAGTSPATFTRLAQALGYSGWEELRDGLVEARRSASDTPFSKRVRPRQSPLEAAEIAREMIGADLAALRGLDPGPILAAAKAILEVPRVWIAGFRSCRGVAQLLHYQLRLFRPADTRLVGGEAPEDLDTGAFASGEAVIVLGFAPYSHSSVAVARAARAAGCVLIALADRPDAPMAEGAAHVLLFDAAAGPSFFPSLTGAVAIAQALAAAVFALGGEAARVRLRETEARLAALSQYVPEESGS